MLFCAKYSTLRKGFFDGRKYESMGENVSVYLNDKLLAWIDSIRKDPLIKCSRGKAIQQLLAITHWQMHLAKIGLDGLLRERWAKDAV